jgi:hypothetical protein
MTADPSTVVVEERAAHSGHELGSKADAGYLRPLPELDLLMNEGLR